MGILLTFPAAAALMIVVEMTQPGRRWPKLAGWWAPRRACEWTIVATSTALIGGGCITQLRQIRAGEVPSAGEVVLVGRAMMMPALPEGGPGGIAVIDAYGVLPLVQMGFSYSPNAPVELEGASGVDEWLFVEPEQPFAAVASRRTRYLRFIRYWRYCRAGAPSPFPRRPAGDCRMTYTVCPARYRVDVQPGESFVYIGSFVCHHDAEIGVTAAVVDEFESLLPRWRTLSAGREVVRRLAR